MSDITMCQSKDCPMRDRCYRHEAKPSQYQSYAVFRWKITPAGFWCRDYMPIWDEK